MRGWRITICWLLALGIGRTGGLGENSSGDLLIAFSPANPDVRRQLAITHINRGHLRDDTRGPKEAEADYVAAVALLKPLAADFPGRSEFRQIGRAAAVRQ